MSDITVFINHVGQTILAEVVSDKGDALKVKNPAVLHVTPNQSGQLQVQLIPLFFREFIDSAKRSEGAVFSFNKDRIVTSEVELEPKICEQYTRIFSATPAPAETGKSGKGSPVIKLFDD
ncbi:MAG: hypothetical protein EBU90_03155 [Proteobacteria bacterium]|nr:hypothetical protein [Pseudomonadota bacterium]NBP13324.1 hypothetical protein [bacterium]